MARRRPAERPAGGRREEVAVARPGVARRGDAGAAAQHHLVAHELAVVLTDRAGRRLEAGVGQVGGRRSTPRPRCRAGRAPAGGAAAGGGAGAARAEVVRRVADAAAPGGHLPLELGREPGAGPAGVGVGLEVADVDDRVGGGRPAAAPCERELGPAVAVGFPVEGGPPALAAARWPSRRTATARAARSPPSAMKASQSPLVTSRSAMRNGREQGVVAGALVVEGEAATRRGRLGSMPPGRRRSSEIGTASPGSGDGPAPAGRPGRSGLRDSTCLMSMSSSSWCCCSWWMPSSISGPTSSQRSRVGAVDERRRARGRPRCGTRPPRRRWAGRSGPARPGGAGGRPARSTS